MPRLTTWHTDGKLVIGYSWYDPKLGFLLTQSELLERGWTKATIQKKLGEPDCYGRNPRGGFTLLYSENRVRRTKLKVLSVAV